MSQTNLQTDLPKKHVGDAPLRGCARGSTTASYIEAEKFGGTRLCDVYETLSSDLLGRTADAPVKPPGSALDKGSLEVGMELGSGEFAVVFAARIHGTVVALKKAALPLPDDVHYVVTLRHLDLEARVLASCAHEHVLGYVGYADAPEENPPSKWIITAFATCGNLEQLLLDAETKLAWPLRIRVAHELSAALAYLHDRCIMHRDVKAANVLLDGSWRVRLGDFGLATFIEDDGRAFTLCGTHEYMAPELHMSTEPYGLAADVFSFGIVLLEICSRQKAKEAINRQPRDCFAVDECAVRELCAGADSSLLELSVQCVSEEPENRPPAADAKEWLDDLAADNTVEDDDLPQTPPPLQSDFVVWTADDAREAPRHFGDASPADGKENVAESLRFQIAFRLSLEAADAVDAAPEAEAEAEVELSVTEVVVELSVHAAASPPRTASSEFDFADVPSSPVLSRVDSGECGDGDTAGDVDVDVDGDTDGTGEVEVQVDCDVDVEFEGAPRQERPEDVCGGVVAAALSLRRQRRIVEDWLRHLRLPAGLISAALRKAGYDDLETLLDVGLEDDDLERAGVANPLHRRLMLESLAAEDTLFSRNLEAAANYDGNLATVAARYRFQRSTVRLSPADVAAFDAAVCYAEARPSPPSVGGAAFDDYLRALAIAAQSDQRLHGDVLRLLGLEETDSPFTAHAPVSAPPIYVGHVVCTRREEGS